MAVAGLLASPGYTAPTAGAQTPSPEQLWDAYPLDPGDQRADPADPAPTPMAGTDRGTVPPGPQAAGEDGDSGLRIPVLIGVVAAFAVGLGAGGLARRRAAATAAELKPATAGAAPMPVAPASRSRTAGAGAGGGRETPRGCSSARGCSPARCCSPVRSCPPARSRAPEQAGNAARRAPTARSALRAGGGVAGGR